MVRIGRSFTPRDKVLPDRNKGGYEITQNRLDHIIARVNNRHRRALNIDGIHAHIWTKTFAGQTCTCQQKSIVIPSGETPARGDLAIVPEVEIQGFKIKRLIPPNQWDTTSFAAEVKDIIEENAQPELNQMLDDLQASSGELSPQEAAQQLNVPSGSLFNEPESVRCGICLGTGKVNGFSLYNGQRIILDASGAVSFKTEAWRIDTSTHPYTLKTSYLYNNVITWSLNLPSYFIKVNIAIRNNTAPAFNILIEFSIDGGNTWTPLTANNLLRIKGYSGITQIRARPAINNINAGFISLTHIELIYDFFNTVKIQAPQLSQSATQDWASPVVTTQIECGGEVIIKPTYTYISLDEKSRGVWLVTDATNHLTSKTQLFGVDATVMRLQDFELPNLLQTYLNPLITLNYTILESLQGNVING